MENFDSELDSLDLSDKPLATPDTAAPQSIPQPMESKSQPPMADGASTQNPDNKDWENVPWSDVAVSAAKHAGPSAANAVKNFGSAIYNYDTTLSGLNDVAKGALSKVQGAMGASQDPVQKAKTEAALNAIAGHYSDVYGGLAHGDTSGLKKELSNDPFSVGMDVASLIPGLGELSGSEKIAVATSLAAKAMDPIQGGLALAGKGAKVAKYLGKGAARTFSGVPIKALDIIEDTAKGTDPLAKEALARFSSGKGNLNEIAQTAMNAVDEAKKNASNAYISTRKSLATEQIDPQPILDAIDKAKKELGVDAMIDSPQTVADLEKMRSMVADRTDFSAVGLDNLKKGLNDLVADRRGSGREGLLATVPQQVRKTIEEADPKYAKLMDQWEGWRGQLKDFQKTLSLNPRASDAQQLAKLMASMKHPGKGAVLDELTKTNAGKYLPQMIAGASTSDWMPSHFNTVADVLMAGGLSALGHPSAILGVAAASPKIVGKAAQAIGAGERLGSKLSPLAGSPTTNVITKMGALKAPQARAVDHPTQHQSDIPQQPASSADLYGNPLRPTAEGSIYKSGGRIARKAGGKVGTSLEIGKMADELINRAAKIRKNDGAGTSSLLNLDDSTIAHALEKANSVI